jgi:hypothetical protein
MLVSVFKTKTCEQTCHENPCWAWGVRSAQASPPDKHSGTTSTPPKIKKAGRCRCSSGAWRGMRSASKTRQVRLAANGERGFSLLTQSLQSATISYFLTVRLLRNGHLRKAPVDDSGWSGGWGEGEGRPCGPLIIWEAWIMLVSVIQRYSNSTIEWSPGLGSWEKWMTGNLGAYILHVIVLEALLS